MMTEQVVHSDLAVPPGEYLEEALEELGMSKDELARRMGRPASKLSEIFRGTKAVTPETALQLERALGVPAHVWTGLEAEYRLALARREAERDEEELRRQAHHIPKFRYQDLVRAGEVERKTRPVDKVRELQAFFGVRSLDSVLPLQRYQAALRYGRAAKRSPEAVAAWLRMGERRAQHTPCAPYRETRLREALGGFREMTLQDAGRWMGPLHEELAGCGVVLVLCTHFPQTGAQGATFWMGREKAVLMVTDRYRWADVFWFSLFHEIGHILMHGTRAVILEDGTRDAREREADTFAADMLVAPDVWISFVAAGRFTPAEVSAFAAAVGVHPGIVVGRLQYEGRLAHDRGNELRERYQWDRAGRPCDTRGGPCM